MLGKGGFGIVYAGVRNRDGLQVAIKHIAKAKIKDWGQVRERESYIDASLISRLERAKKRGSDATSIKNTPKVNRKYKMSFPHTFLTSLRLLSIRQRSRRGRIMYTSTTTGVSPRPSGASLSFDDARPA